MTFSNMIINGTEIAATIRAEVKDGIALRIEPNLGLEGVHPDGAEGAPEVDSAHAVIWPGVRDCAVSS